MKRQRRTLVNFQESFFKPLIKKTAWRYMQFDAEKYPSRDYHFSVVSSLGVIAREYEVQQLAQILQVVPPESPVHSAMLKAIIGHLNVTSKETLLATIDAASQPNPEAQQMQQQQMMLQMELLQAQIAAVQGQATESAARAEKYTAEKDLAPQELMLKYSDMDKDGEVDDGFDKKLALARMLMEEDKWGVEKEERLAAIKNAATEQDTLRQMLAPQPSPEEPQIQ